MDITAQELSVQQTYIDDYVNDILYPGSGSIVYYASSNTIYKIDINAENEPSIVESHYIGYYGRNPSDYTLSGKTLFTEHSFS